MVPLTLKARGVMPTVMHLIGAQMLLGAGPEQHGITNNGWTTTNYTVEATIKIKITYFPQYSKIIKDQKTNLKQQCSMIGKNY